MQTKIETVQLYHVVQDHIPSTRLKKLNKTKAWAYGYNKEYDMVVISKDGTIGEVYDIQGLKVALPSVPKDVHKRAKAKTLQYWEPVPVPEPLRKIKTRYEFESRSNTFKATWTPYINDQFDKRELGFWFKNNGKDTYVTGSHWFYLTHCKIDVGLPDYREANRLLYIFWEACKADSRCYGMLYVKIRRSGFSYMSSGECVNIGTIYAESRIGILSKTGADARTMFTGKVVPINFNLPFFFKPIMDGMDRPKTELAYRMPATKLTKKSVTEINNEEEEQGLNSSIDWKTTGDNSYDGEKLKLLIQDEASKWVLPDNIESNWKVTKTCLRLGRKVIGKCLMGSTVNSLKSGGSNFKSLHDKSNVNERSKNGQTKSGLYSLFIPCEWNWEGFIDRYGMPVMETPAEPVEGVDGEMIDIGAVEHWENEYDSLKETPTDLNEFLRQFPRTLSHAFRDDSKNSIFPLGKIYEQLDYTGTNIIKRTLQRGTLSWKDGVRDTQVVWTPDNQGRFFATWLPPKDMANAYTTDNWGKRVPGNADIGAVGVDSYDISGVVGGGGSKGAAHGKTKFSMDPRVPSEKFIFEYISRPPMAELFYEDMVMAMWFWGLPGLIENNKPGLLYYMKNRGLRNYALNRPDKHLDQLSKSEKELGGIPSSTGVITLHAEALEAYINQHIGIDHEGKYREIGQCGDFAFERTLLDWANYDIMDRTRYDATISSGLACMATNRLRIRSTSQPSKINLNFVRYDNSGLNSKVV